MSESPAGVSRRAYARSRKISEAVVRKYLREGKLTEALLPDGTLDGEKADRLLAASITQGNNQPVGLSTAKLRRLRAQVRKLNDDVRNLRRRLVTPADVTQLTREVNEIVAGHLRPIVDRLAPIVAGMKGDAAHVSVRDAIYDALEAISSDTAFDRLGPEKDEAEEELDLGGLGEVDLLATRINLQAEKLERERGLALGHFVRVEDVTDADSEKLAICKSLLLAIPGRVAIHMEGATVERARTLLAEEIEQAIAALD